jgi:hypothetical protein
LTRNNVAAVVAATAAAFEFGKGGTGNECEYTIHVDTI